MNGVANGLYGGDLPNQINTPWIDFSEQSTIVGWSVYTVKIIRYKVVGKILIVNFTISGTSNSTTTSFTIPFNAGNLNANNLSNIIRGTNSGSSVIAWAIFTSGSNILTHSYMSTYGTVTSTWTASGTKFITGQYIIEID
jgi:hypothetical protein